MEKQVDLPLSALAVEDLENIADQCLSGGWRKIGLAFQKTHNFVITYEQLQDQHKHESDWNLRHALFHKLAAQGITIAELADALDKVGFKAVARILRTYNNANVNKVAQPPNVQPSKNNGGNPQSAPAQNNVPNNVNQVVHVPNVQPNNNNGMNPQPAEQFVPQGPNNNNNNVVDEEDDEPIMRQPLPHENNGSLCDVFISFCGTDSTEFVSDLQNRLDHMGISAFFANNMIEYGERWKDQIFEAINAAKVGVIILSPNFFKKGWPKEEFSRLYHRTQDRTSRALKLVVVWRKLPGKAFKALQNSAEYIEFEKTQHFKVTDFQALREPDAALIAQVVQQKLSSQIMRKVKSFLKRRSYEIIIGVLVLVAAYYYKKANDKL